MVVLFTKWILAIYGFSSILNVGGLMLTIPCEPSLACLSLSCRWLGALLLNCWWGLSPYACLVWWCPLLQCVRCLPCHIFVVLCFILPVVTLLVLVRKWWGCLMRARVGVCMYARQGGGLLPVTGVLVDLLLLPVPPWSLICLDGGSAQSAESVEDCTPY